MAAHLEARTDQLVHEGSSVTDAVTQAELEFGDIERHLDAATRELPLGDRSRVAAELSAAVSDFRFAALSLRRNRRFSVTAVAMLAAAIAVSATVFAVASAYLLRPLPYPDAERVVLVTRTPIDAPATPLQAAVPGGLNGIDWDRRDQILEYSAAWELDGFGLVGGDGAEVVNGAWVTADIFPITGAKTQLGRVFTPEDVRAGSPVAVLSHNLWASRYGSDSSVLGTTIRAWSNDRPDDSELFEVIGVLRPGFWSPGLDADLLVPLTGTRRPSLARLRRGVSIEEASQHLTRIAADRLPAVDPGWEMVVTPLQTALFGRLGPALKMLSGTVILVLLIAAANVAVLNLVRSMGRHHEFAIRAAIGAGRQRIFRQFTVEGVLLVVMAATIGLGVAAGLLGALAGPIQSYLGAAIPGGQAGLAIDTRVVLIVSACAAMLVLGLSVVTTLSLRTGFTTLRAATTHTKDLRILRSGLVALEVALTFSLLVGAGQLLTSTRALSQTETGFSSAEVLKAGLALRERSYPTGSMRINVFYDIVGRVRQNTGARSVALTRPYPFEPRSRRGELLIPEGASGQEDYRAVHHTVTESYFSTLGIPVVQGRNFSPADAGDSEPVLIVSRALADLLWPGQPAIGKRVRTGSWRSMPSVANSPWRTVVGVAGDVTTQLSGESFPATYVPYRQNPISDMSILLAAPRVGSLVPGLTDAVAAVDSDLPVRDIVPLDELIAADYSQSRFLTTLLVVFSAFAVLLAVAGTHSVVAYSVSLRRREAAIRSALGATRSEVTRSLMRLNIAAAGIGLGVGVMGARVLDLGLISTLPSIQPAGLEMYVAIGASILGLLAVSTWLPARRACREAPARILRGS